MPSVLAEQAPLRRPGHIEEQAQPIDPLGRQPASRSGPYISRAQRQVQIEAEKSLATFHVARPTSEKLDVLPIMSPLQRLQIMLGQILSGEVAALVANSAGSLGQE